MADGTTGIPRHGASGQRTGRPGTVTELLDVLGPIERFWALPGVQTYREGQRLFAADKYDRFAALVAKANRAA
jgi:hypothetical protein